MKYLADVVVMSIQFLLFAVLLILGLKHHTYIDITYSPKKEVGF